MLNQSVIVAKSVYIELSCVMCHVLLSPRVSVYVRMSGYEVWVSLVGTRLVAPTGCCFTVFLSWVEYNALEQIINYLYCNVLIVVLKSY